MSEQEVSLSTSGSQGEQKPLKLGEAQSKIEIPAGASSKDVVDAIMKMSQDDVLPWENFSLPSKGYFYGGKIPDGKVQMRPMGLHTEKILATQRLLQTGQALDEIYKKCVRFPTQFDPLDLLNGDRTFILFILRGISHGNIYEFAAKCTKESCGATSTYEYDLNEVGKHIRYPESSEEPVKLIMPHLSKVTGREVYAEVRYLRGRDTQIMNQTRKVKESLTGGMARSSKELPDDKPIIAPVDNTLEENIYLAVQSISGVTDRIKIQHIVQNKLHEKDFDIIFDWLADSAPGIDAEIVITCPKCQNEMTLDLPITESFLRPKKRRGGGS